MLNQTYERALINSRKATQQFRTIQKLYRSRQINDVEYLTALAAYNACCATFDAAYDKEIKQA